NGTMWTQHRKPTPYDATNQQRLSTARGSHQHQGRCPARHGKVPFAGEQFFEHQGRQTVLGTSYKCAYLGSERIAGAVAPGAGKARRQVNSQDSVDHLGSVQRVHLSVSSEVTNRD